MFGNASVPAARRPDGGEFTEDALKSRQHLGSGSGRVRVIRGRLLYESAPERMAADLQLLGNLDLGAIAGAQEGARFLQVRLGERLGPAADTSAPSCGLEAGVNTLAQDIALDLTALACFIFRFLKRPQMAPGDTTVGSTPCNCRRGRADWFQHKSA